MSLGDVLWSAGSGGEILSQASNYKAEPHSEDMLLIDCTSPSSNKTKVEKNPVCVCVSYPSGPSEFVSVCECVREKWTRSVRQKNTVTHSSL